MCLLTKHADERIIRMSPTSLAKEKKNKTKKKKQAGKVVI